MNTRFNPDNIHDDLGQLLVLVIITVLVTMAFNLNKAQAQHWEIGAMVGSSNYLGEIGGDEKVSQPLFIDMQSEHTNLALGVYTRFYLNKWVAAKANFLYGTISGDDRLSSNYARHLRNLHFKSHLLEFAIQPELTIFQLGRRGHRYNLRGINGWDAYHIRSYMFFGAAVFNFNPKAEYQGEWHNLQPLGTEGQYYKSLIEPYKLTQISLPLGTGLTLIYNKSLSIGLEIGWRKTFTDYLDDVSTKYADPALVRAEKGEVAAALSNRTSEVSDNPEDLRFFKADEQRGNHLNDDSYIFTVLTIGYYISR